jgi:hypothetical protein
MYFSRYHNSLAEDRTRTGRTSVLPARRRSFSLMSIPLSPPLSSKLRLRSVRNTKTNLRISKPIEILKPEKASLPHNIFIIFYALRFLPLPTHGRSQASVAVEVGERDPAADEVVELLTVAGERDVTFFQSGPSPFRIRSPAIGMRSLRRGSGRPSKRHSSPFPA